MKLNRKQIKEALKQTPIEKVILGHTNSGVSLTAKQKAFAEKVAEGMTKAEAYRTTYDTKASKQQQGHQAHTLSLNPKIAAMIEAQKVALEAMKYQTPQHLRALAVQRLTEIAIDPETKPAQQLKALELIGKMTEVALFTERKEVVQIRTTEEARAKLIEGIKQAMQDDSAIDAEYTTADDLLAELRGDSEAEHEQTEAEPIEPASDTENETQEGDAIDKSETIDPTTPPTPKTSN